MSAGLGGFSGIARRNGRVLAGNGAKNAKNRNRFSGAGRRGLPPTETPAKTARFHPASLPQNPATGGKPHRITAKPTVFPSLAISAKCGHRRGVPEELRRRPKTGVFPPRLRDMAVISSVFTGKLKRERPRFGGLQEKMQKSTPVYPACGVGICPRRPAGTPRGRPLRKYGSLPTPLRSFQKNEHDKPRRPHSPRPKTAGCAPYQPAKDCKTATRFCFRRCA
jgi:hypothetical protein